MPGPFRIRSRLVAFAAALQLACGSSTPAPGPNSAPAESNVPRRDRNDAGSGGVAPAGRGSAPSKPTGTSGTAAADPIPSRCGDERDVLLHAYDTQGIPIDLDCADFTKDRGTPSLAFTQLFRATTQPWALLRAPLLAAKDSGYGLDLMIDAFGAPRAINSSYRDPVRNKQAGGARRSRHMFGDAADLDNVTKSPEEWQRMWTAAEKANADYIEPLSGPCKLNCLHADWRNHDGGYRP